MSRSLLSCADVARKLRMTVGHFYKRKAALMAEHGFPGPVPGMGKRWDEGAIDAWLDRHMPADLKAASAAAPDDASAWERRLIERAAALW